MKKLYLSKKDRKLFGVCGGMGEYWEVDPTVIRLLWVLVTIITGIVPGIIGYFIAALAIPERERGEEAGHES